MDVFSIIMAGGGGTRFWPLSRNNMPKQLLNISGKDIMINETISRYNGWIPDSHTYIVTNSSQKKVLDEILNADIPRGNILAEPMGRNTAPCILLAAMQISELYGDGIMVVLPSDHYIGDNERFLATLKMAGRLAEEKDALITIGIQPAFPSTGYGYIRKGSSFTALAGVKDTCEVDRFVEKPVLEKAKEYLKSGEYLWNSGIFVWKVSIILDAFRRFLPKLYKSMQKLEGLFGKPELEDRLREVYADLAEISVDHGILERADNVYTIPGDFGWNDVGSWDALGSIFPSDENGNIIKADHIGIGTKGSIIYGNQRFIATLGLENVVIVDTEDALMVCAKDKAQDVKKIVEELKERGKTMLV